MTGVGSITSHHGSERNRESAASRLTRWVVPDRGSPTTMTGGSSSTSRASGYRVTWSSNRSRALSSPTSLSLMMKRPSPDNPRSASTAADLGGQPIEHGWIAELVETGRSSGVGDDAVHAEVDFHAQRPLVSGLFFGCALRLPQVLDPHLVGHRRTVFRVRSQGGGGGVPGR